jgi:HK97 family phage major capsid protein
MNSPAGFLSNMSMLQKADLALSDLTSGGGILQPETAQKFMRILIDESKLMKLATVIPMKSMKMEIPKIRFTNRILRAGQTGVALDSGSRAKPDLTNTELNAALFKAEVRLPNEVLEDNIERDQLKNTIMQLMAEAISRDMDDAIVNSSTTSSDPFYANLPFGGILQQTVTNTVDAQDQFLNKNVFKALMKTMPTPFLRNRADLRFLTSVHAEIDYRDSLASRQTPGGDSYLVQAGEAAYSGIPVVEVPLFPENLGVDSNTTDAVLTDPKNATVGIWREIRMETDKDVSAGVVIVVASLRFDMRWAEETATVKAVNVQVSS